MSHFIQRILKSSTASSITKSSRHGAPPSSTPSTPASTSLASSVHHLLDEIQHAKLVYFGEFHSEHRIISFQTELVKQWSKRLGSAPAVDDAPKDDVTTTDTSGRKPRLHLIMEHFSVDMQELLERYQFSHSRDAIGHDENATCFPEDDDEAFQKLLHSYKNDYGTEGHDLMSYSKLIQFCRETNRKSTGGSEINEGYCQVLIHGGFIPRNHAARLNKECPDEESKRLFFEEMSNQRGYLPRSREAMYDALFQSSYKPGNKFTLRGTQEHKLLIQSLMNGADLYSPLDHDNPVEEEAISNHEETPFDRLYQAQLLKDHAMGYRIANIMLDHQHKSPTQTDMHPSSSDRYLVIAGFGHLKHHLGVPDCVKRYLRQVAISHPDESRRAVALDLLINISHRPTSYKSRSVEGSGSALIGCQMMYEAYLEDSYPPLVEAIKKATQDDEDANIDEIKQRFLKDLYLRNPTILDEYILKSDEVSGPLLRFNRGSGGFDHPCADYLFVYDEDDDHIITDSDISQMVDSAAAKCPFHSAESTANDIAKRETVEAYEQVGHTAGIRGNAARARAIMTQLGYSDDDLAYLGDGDIYNFQGVANPHSVAKIQPGECVIDIGSGLGIDSFLATRDCGAHKADNEPHSQSFVVGVDLALSEVQHATTRAKERGYAVPERLRFLHGDVERLQEILSKHNVPSENAFDVCISNGAFCLVPDKRKAFQNVFKALRPGGRCAISTTTIVSDRLDPSFEWPVCMRMFASLETLQPMLEDIGFRNVQIIDAESPMEGMELPEDDPHECEGDKRFKIHGKYADQFAFLEKMDMDELCKVVTVYGEKL
ncbi:hypothetical protein ACHAW6_014539 [Cyclotella cf. meneghiniana]